MSSVPGSLKLEIWAVQAPVTGGPAFRLLLLSLVLFRVGISFRAVAARMLYLGLEVAQGHNVTSQVAEGYAEER